MDKKNTILLTVIAIATLLVAVVGATFAYFATTQNVNANIPANVTTAGTAASFTSQSNGDITITVDANEMQQAQGDDNNVITGLRDDDAYLEVQLGAAQDGKSSVCTYDIIFTWTSGEYTLKQGTGQQKEDGSGEEVLEETAHYVRTYDKEQGMKLPREFTIIATPTVEDPAAEEDRITTIVGEVPTTGDNITATVETNIDEFAIEGQRKIANPAQPDSEIDADYTTLIRGLKIESKSSTDKTKVKWTFSAKFYNTTKDQTVQMNKTYTGMISVNPDTIKC